MDEIEMSVHVKYADILSGVQENKYLSWMYGVDRKICHEGH